MAWRDVKRTARETVHQTMKVRALYIASLPVDSNTEYPEIEIRIHPNEKRLGDQPGTSYNSAEMFEPVPKIVCWRENLEQAAVTLSRNGIISVAEGEAYRVGVVHPHDTETITADVTRVEEADTADFPVPE